MKHKKEMITALVCITSILLFVIGMRAGLHDAAVKSETELNKIVDYYETQIENLRFALEEESKYDHTILSYEYIPLPTDYENIGTEMPKDSDAVLLSKMAYGEYRDTRNKNQIAATMWVALNRLDNDNPYYPDTLEGVITQPNQFMGYNKYNPVDSEIYQIALDVLSRRNLEQLGVGDVGRIVPIECVSFRGDGKINHFYMPDGTEWKFTCDSPYDTNEIILK